MTQYEMDKKISTHEAWMALRPKTQYIYKLWISRYSKFLQSSQIQQGSPKEKILTFLQEGYATSSPASKRQAIAAITWFYTNILMVSVNPIRVKREHHIPERFDVAFIANELRRLPLKYEFMGWLFACGGLSLSDAVNVTHDNFTCIQGDVVTLSIGKRIIPLNNHASRLYRGIHWKGGRLFPKTLNMFCQMSRKYNVDRRITPYSLRANFILLSLETNDIAWTSAVTGLSDNRLREYYEMLPVEIRRSVG